MIPRTTPSQVLKQPRQEQLLPGQLLLSSVTPSPHPHQKKGRQLKSPIYHLHKKHTLPSQTATAVPPDTKHSSSQEDEEEEEAKKQKTRQYNKAHREKLKQDGKFETHKERVRLYNAKRRQTLNVMAKEYGLSVRKMEQKLKETKKNTGVDLLSIAVNGDQRKEDKGSNNAKEEVADDAARNKNISTQMTPPQQQQQQQQVHSVKNNGIPAAQTYLAQHCCSQTPQPSSSVKTEETKELTKQGAKTTVSAKNKVITPSTTPPPGGINLSAPPTTTATTATSIDNPEKQKKNKHNEHNRAYRDKLKQDKRRYEEHKEKARQYNEKRRKKLRAMAKETGLTMKEMEKTIREAKIISALTMTASKEAEKLTPVPTSSTTTTTPPTRHLIPVVTNPRLPPLQATSANCLDILSDAASMVLSQSHHQYQLHTPISPRRQYRTVSEDNCDSSMERWIPL